MAFRISPVWWPVLLAASPVVVPLLALSAETTVLKAGATYCV